MSGIAGGSGTPRATVRSRLFAVLALTALCSIAVTAAATLVLGGRAARAARADGLARQADATVSALDASGGRVRPQLRVLTVGAAATPVRPAAPARARAVRAALADRDPGDGTVTVGDRRLLYALRGSQTGPVVLIRPTGRQAGDLRPLGSIVAVAALAGLALAAALAALTSRRLTRPLSALAAAVHPVGAGALPRPVPETGPRELAELAAAFNAMARQLDDARSAERRFLMTVSHELRTPLTSIRGYAEALADGHVDRDEAAPVLEAEAARLDRLVGDLLDLASVGSASFTVADDTVDLAEIAQTAIARHRVDAARRGITLAVDTPAPAPARGDAARLLQAVSNLVENALRVTPPGGTVTIAAAAGRLAVIDTGPGLDPDDLERAFERFRLHRRSGPATAGSSGLGLALVAELLAAMGGRATAASEHGGGTRFTLELRR